MDRDEMLQRLATAYFKVLSSVDWGDPLVIAGMREGLNKFLSNAHLALFNGGNKYHKTHWVSANALDRLHRRQHGGLVWEHLVPKTVYIQEPCERCARDGELNREFISDRLGKYWHLATITKDEDQELHPTQMPDGWDKVNVHARYEAAGIKLLPNPFFANLRPLKA